MKVISLKNLFRGEYVNISARQNGFHCHEVWIGDEILKEAADLVASTTEEMCLVVDDEGKLLTTYSGIAVVFNARVSEKKLQGTHVVSYNDGRGALTEFFCDWWLTSQPGSYFLYDRHGDTTVCRFDGTLVGRGYRHRDQGL